MWPTPCRPASAAKPGAGPRSRRSAERGDRQALVLHPLRAARSSAGTAWSAPAGPSLRARSSAPTASAAARSRCAAGRPGSARSPTPCTAGGSAMSARTAQQEGLFLIHSIQRNIAAPVWERLRTRSRPAAGRRRASGRRGVQALARHPDAQRRQARRQPQRRQQAEGQPQQVAGGEARDPLHRRADRRHRYPHQVRDPPGHLPARRGRHVGRAHLLRHARDDPPCRPHPRLPRRRRSSANCRTPGATTR